MSSLYVPRTEIHHSFFLLFVFFVTLIPSRWDNSRLIVRLFLLMLDFWVGGSGSCRLPWAWKDRAREYKREREKRSRKKLTCWQSLKFHSFYKYPACSVFQQTGAHRPTGLHRVRQAGELAGAGVAVWPADGRRCFGIMLLKQLGILYVSISPIQLASVRLSSP